MTHLRARRLVAAMQTATLYFREQIIKNREGAIYLAASSGSLRVGQLLAMLATRISKTESILLFMKRYTPMEMQTTDRRVVYPPHTK
jgi:hypothetical protein